MIYPPENFSVLAVLYNNTYIQLFHYGIEKLKKILLYIQARLFLEKADDIISSITKGGLHHD